MSEEVGKHKGAVETLLHEKKELSRLLQIVSSQLERHLSAMEEKGIDTDQFIQQIQQQENQGQEQERGASKSKGSDRGKGKQQNRQNSRRRNNSNSGVSKDGGSTDKDGSSEDFLGSDEDDRDFSPL